MRLELYDKHDRRMLGHSDDFRQDDWMFSNHDDFVYNLIPIKARVTRTGHIAYIKIVFPRGRKHRINVDLKPSVYLTAGMSVDFDPKNLRIAKSAWRRALRGPGSVAQGVAIKAGEL